MSAQILTKTVEGNSLKFANRIIKNMDRADMMIRDLLDASKIKAGEKVSMDISQFVLHDLASTTAEDLSIVHGNRFEVKGSTKLEVFWDLDVTRRILENLITNAVKYGSPQTPITILFEEKQKFIELSVHNLGNPIPFEDQANLFDYYKRSESADRGVQKGWGIGLTLVRGFADAMGGSVSVVSSPEQGTKFNLLIPIDLRMQT
jgi:signal transduction histidine kinase